MVNSRELLEASEFFERVLKNSRRLSLRYFGESGGAFRDYDTKEERDAWVLGGLLGDGVVFRSKVVKTDHAVALAFAVGQGGHGFKVRAQLSSRNSTFSRNKSAPTSLYSP